MITPNPYLSWSQLDLFEHSPEMYAQVYIHGKKRPVNKAMLYGGEFANHLESGEMTGSILTDLAISRVPKLDISEYKLEATVKIDDKTEIPVLCYIDSISNDLTRLYEYKTGKARWDQKRVDQHGQLTFYAMALREVTGKIPESIQLIWIQTDNDELGKIVPTGEVYIFNSRQTMSDILKMKVRVKSAWRGIQQLVERELT